MLNPVFSHQKKKHQKTHVDVNELAVPAENKLNSEVFFS